MEQPKIISLTDVSYIYPGSEEPALSDISFEVRQGEWIALVGSNGSGKSTLAKHLNALLIPVQGACFIHGMDTASEENTWSIRSTVSMVFQNPENQIVSTVVEDDVAFGPENLGLSPEEICRRVEGALSICGLTEKAQKAVYTLSGGQKQRLAIAGALAMGAKCIVLDEATAMLDPEGRQEIGALLRDLHSRGITIILVTHRLEEVLDADRVLVLNGGHIEWQGTPTELFCTKNAYSAALHEKDINSRWGLEVPPILRLKERLVAAGMISPDTPANADGIRDACICKLQERV